MQPRGGHLCFDLGTARHNETLAKRIKSAHDCKTDKNSYELENSSRKGRILFFATLSRLLPWLRKKHEGMISLVKRRHMMYHVKNYHSCKGRRMKQFLCKRTPSLYSNVIRIGEEDTTKPKTVTITSRKYIYVYKTKQKIKTNKRKQRSFLSVYFSLGAAVGSRIIQSQEPKRSDKKLTRKNKKRDLPSFSPCTLSKTLSGPHNLNSAPLFLVLCSETARKRLLHWLRRTSKNRLDPG